MSKEKKGQVVSILSRMKQRVKKVAPREMILCLDEGMVEKIEEMKQQINVTTDLELIVRSLIFVYIYLLHKKRGYTLQLVKGDNIVTMDI